MHGVPDKVIFGPSPRSSGDVTYADVRALDEQGRIDALRKRFEKWVIDQTKPLAASDASPFPLAVMCCVGIEALGQIAFGKGANLNFPFVSVADLIDSRFHDPMPATFLGALKKRQPSATATTGSELLYTFFRNSMIHGYRGRAVFLTADETPDVMFDTGVGAMLLNPFWLWKQYVQVSNHVLNMIAKTTAPPMRRNAVRYLRKMLE